MLTLCASRCAAFAAVGVGLMLFGAWLPEGNVIGMILIIAGANVAFLALRRQTRSFTWGADARGMLWLCAAAMAAGLALLVASTRADEFNAWLVLLCLGLYLCSFAVWNVQQPVGGRDRILAVAGAMLMLFGAMVGSLAWQEWRVLIESEETPQQITLRDLLDRGYGNNRYLRLMNFRFCDHHHFDEGGQEDSPIKTAWFPVVLGDPRDAPNASAFPARVEATVSYVYVSPLKFGDANFLAQEEQEWRLRRRIEGEGYECTVVSGVKRLPRAVRRRLCEAAPQTDPAQVVILESGRPLDAWRVYGWLGGGAGSFALGLVLLSAVFWKVGKTTPTISPPHDHGGAAGHAQHVSGAVAHNC